MYEGRLKRNSIPITIGVITSLICYFGLNIQPKMISNYTDFMSGILSISSIATGFLMASFALIPALPNSKLIKLLRNSYTDLKLLDRMLITMIGFILGSLLSLIMLFFNSESSNGLAHLLLALLFGILIFSFIEAFVIIHILFKVIEAEYKNIKKSDKNNF
ncbi:hypothetical protein [Lactobacillus sp. PV034]|uniref:hypothetical protein n=1 Tax=Lactobacillus sp. PV034 TaxID=2594495 RepID=UPI00223E9CD9|nr:hypothetical protein [Lactobacillus sp. PV034]QNQ80512.1 hypothetical protein FP432_02575 [Lactobacillus sp. PV034]